MNRARKRERLVADLEREYLRTTGEREVDEADFLSWLLSADVSNDFMVESMVARARALPNHIRELPPLRPRVDWEGPQ